ncbi:nuclear transport factor 2 family protein [Streptomyces sp. NBC_00203]|uniref:nuclear transport factor 2 family protein n=1 Tax=Streptomyces sp. NBC_00203 TaxID=2975680 RepID=UPI003251FEF8
MPIIELTLVEGFADDEQKSDVITKLADVVVNVFGEITKPNIFSLIREVKPGSWSIGGVVADQEMVAGGKAISNQQIANRLDEARVIAAYEALASGDRAEIDKYWDADMTWLVPGEAPVSGLKQGLDTFLAFMGEVGALADNSFAMERTNTLVKGDTSVDLTHNTATRAGDSSRKLDIDVVHVMRWRDGKIVEGRGSIFGTGTTEYNEFFA